MQISDMQGIRYVTPVKGSLKPQRALGTAGPASPPQTEDTGSCHTQSLWEWPAAEGVTPLRVMLPPGDNWKMMVAWIRVEVVEHESRAGV